MKFVYKTGKNIDHSNIILVGLGPYSIGDTT